MGYGNAVARVTFSGSCLGGNEIWSTGLWMGFDGSDVESVVPEAAGVAAAAWQTFFTTSTTSISQSYDTQVVKVARILANGQTDTENISYHNYPSAIVGGGGASALPPQIALVATMTSDKQRGPASKGRMYIPGVNATITANTGKIGTTTHISVATNFQTFLDSLNGTFDLPGSVILAYNKPDIDPIPGVGYQRLVTGCRVGDVYDTQRRRRNALNEVYQSRVLA